MALNIFNKLHALKLYANFDSTSNNLKGNLGKALLCTANRCKHFILTKTSARKQLKKLEIIATR